MSKNKGIPTKNKSNSRSTTRCCCGRHTINKSVEVDGVLVNGTWHYQQWDCWELPNVNYDDIAINEGSNFQAKRCRPWVIKFEFSQKTSRNYFAYCLDVKKINNEVAYAEGNTAYSITHILKVVLQDSDVEAFINVDQEGFTPLYTVKQFKTLTDIGRSFKSYLI